MSNDLDDLVATVRKRGYPVIQGGKHRHVLDPETGKKIVTISTSSKSNRAYANVVRDLRHAGVLEYDPRQEGQMRPFNGGYMQGEREEEVAALVDKVLSSGFTRQEFMRHAYEISKARLIRPFKTIEATGWHVANLINATHEVRAWALDNIEAAASDLLEVPAPEPVVTEMPKSQPGVLFPPTPEPLDEQLLADLTEIYNSIVEGLNLILRTSKTVPHGIIPLLGGITMRTMKRHKLVLASRTKHTEKNLGHRMMRIIQGTPPWKPTRRVAEQVVEDWKQGYRLRPEDLSGKFGGVEGPIPYELLDDELKAVEVTIPLEPEIPPITEEQWVEAEVVEPERFEQIPVAYEPPEEEPALEYVEVSFQEQIAADYLDRVTGKRMQMVIPAAWEDGEEPLHLRMLRTILNLPDAYVDEIIDLAREIMLTELRAG